MSDRRTIDFTAERNKRRGIEEQGADIGNVPDYMKILYGEDAVDHMDDGVSSFFDEEEIEEPVAPVSVRPYKEPSQKKKKQLYGVQETDFDDDEDVFDGLGEGEEIVFGGKKKGEEGVSGEKKKKVKKTKEISEKKRRRMEKRLEKKKRDDERLERAINEPMVRKHMGDKERNKSAVKGIAVAAAAAVLMIVLAVVSIIGVSRNSTYKLSYISEGEIVKTGSGEACFIRTGDVLEATAEGVFVPNVNEGDKVPAGYVVGYITDDDYVNDVIKLRNLEKVILSMQNMEGFVGAVDQSELESAEAQILSLRKKLSDMAKEGRFENGGDLMVQLSAALNYKNQLIIEAESGEASVNSLQQERRELEKKLSSKMVPVESQIAGVVSFNITGSEYAENKVYPNIENPAEGFTVNTSGINNTAQYVANTKVQKGQLVARVITSQDYYIVMTTKEDYSTYAGRKITLTSGDGHFSAKGTILSVEQGNGTENTITVKTNRSLVESLAGVSTVSFEISRNTGYCVPLTALNDWDKPAHTARLAVVRAGIVRFVYVTVVDHDDEFAIIKNNVYSDSDVYYGDELTEDEQEPLFKANDCYIVNAGRVKEGQVITE